MTSPHLEACPENKNTPITKEGTRVLGALGKELGAETNICLCYYFTSGHRGTGIGFPHLQCLDLPHYRCPPPSVSPRLAPLIPSSADLPPNPPTILFTSSLWALYSPSLPIHVGISCIYLTASLPLHVSITWPYYSWLHLLLLRRNIVPGAGMQYLGGEVVGVLSIVNTSTKRNAVKCQWLKIKQVKEIFFFWKWSDGTIIDKVAESGVSEGVIFE